MAVEIVGRNVPHAYEDMLWQLKVSSEEENSRNGLVKTIQRPVELTIYNPLQRVLFDPARDANPFFHVMEFVWMMSGSKDLAWIKRFNSGFEKYSDDGKTLPASYGYRWRKHWHHDQITVLVDHLRNDITSRRAVLAMWDPFADQSPIAKLGADLPCNTHIYFRVIGSQLDMTVMNRSNDAIWGMMGANVVHMTLLHELVAHGVGVKIGTFRIYTNNLHIYEHHWHLLNVPQCIDPYREQGIESIPLLRKDESYRQFILDCEGFVLKDQPPITYWMRTVAKPIADAYLNKGDRKRRIADIEAPDWKLACEQWVERREKNA